MKKNNVNGTLCGKSIAKYGNRLEGIHAFHCCFKPTKMKCNFFSILLVLVGFNVLEVYKVCYFFYTAHNEIIFYASKSCIINYIFHM